MTGPPQPSPAAGGVVPAPRSGPPAPGGGLPPPARKARNRKLRLWLAMGAGIVTLLCVGGIGVFISLYDEATEIKRSEPDAVVDNFLGSYFMNRDDREASLYTCDDADLAALSAYRETMIKVEKDHTVSVRVSWSSLTVATNGATGTVTTELVQTATDSSRLSDTWQFEVADRNGWRVCGATELD